MADNIILTNITGAEVLKLASKDTGNLVQLIKVLASGVVVTVPITPVLTVSGAYSSGDCVGTKISLAGQLLAGKHYALKSVHVADLDNQGAQLTLTLFKADPAAGTYTDNSAPAPDAAGADLAKKVLVHTVFSTDYDGTTQKFAASDAAGQMFLATGTEFAVLKTAGTPTYTHAPVLTCEFIQID